MPCGAELVCHGHVGELNYYVTVGLEFHRETLINFDCIEGKHVSVLLQKFEAIVQIESWACMIFE